MLIFCNIAMQNLWQTLPSFCYFKIYVICCITDKSTYVIY